MDLSLDKKTIGCKLVFVVKGNFDESIAYLKTFLVTKGHAQTYELDCPTSVATKLHRLMILYNRVAS